MAVDQRNKLKKVDQYPLDGLAQALSRAESYDGYELARTVLAYDQQGYTHVVGVSVGIDQVYLYHCEHRELVAFDLSDEGLSNMGTEISSDVVDDRVQEWIETKPWLFGWVHPRYRVE